MADKMWIMRRYKVIIGLLCIVLLVSVGLNVAQFIEFRRAGARFMAQVDLVTADAFRHLDDFITGVNRSPGTLYEFSMQLSALHSLLSSNVFPAYQGGFFPDFRLTERMIYSGVSTNRGDFHGIFSDGVVSENEIKFLEALREKFIFLRYNITMDIRLFNETLENLRAKWETLPLHLLKTE